MLDTCQWAGRFRVILRANLFCQGVQRPLRASPGWRHPTFRATNGAYVAVRVSLANIQNLLREEGAQNVLEREVRQGGRSTATCKAVGQGQWGLSERQDPIIRGQGRAELVAGPRRAGGSR